MAMETRNKLRIDIELTLHRDPSFKFFVNNILLTEPVTTLYFDLLDDIHLSYQSLSNAGAVEIQNISVNGNQILPKYLHLASPPTNWIEKINHWDFSIPSPFYKWHQVITGQGDAF